MTNEVYIVTNSVVTSLDVLKSVNDMYSSEFTRLLTVMGLLVGFGGVVLPLLFQIREARVARSQITMEIGAAFANERKELLKNLQEDLKRETDLTKKEIDKQRGLTAMAHLNFAIQHNHLANANKRIHLKVINERLGFPLPLIVTPMELFRERDDL
jgi:hypothetical protein